MLDFSLDISPEYFGFFGSLLILKKKKKKHGKMMLKSKKFNILETSEVINDPHRQFLALHVLAFVSYCQNPEIFIHLCSVNYHPLIIYRNLYQFSLLIERTKRSSLCCVFSRVEQMKKGAKGRMERNYFSSSEMLNESWKEYKKSKNQATGESGHGLTSSDKVFDGRNLTWKQLLFPR